jgi:hypothetical protein
LAKNVGDFPENVGDFLKNVGVFFGKSGDKKQDDRKACQTVGKKALKPMRGQGMK